MLEHYLYLLRLCRLYKTDLDRGREASLSMDFIKEVGDRGCASWIVIGRLGPSSQPVR